MARILIVDDDEQIRLLFERVLTGAGHEVTSAGDAKRALRIQRDDPHDLLVCDLIMPDMDGLELIRALRAEGHEAPIVAVSGGSYVAAEHNLAMAGFLGATRILPKPFPNQRLVDVVAELLAETP